MRDSPNDERGGESSYPAKGETEPEERYPALSAVGRCIHRCAEAGRAAADDEHVPLGGVVSELLNGFGTIHGSQFPRLFERERTFVEPAGT